MQHHAPPHRGMPTLSSTSFGKSTEFIETCVFCPVGNRAYQTHQLHSAGSLHQHAVRWPL